MTITLTDAEADMIKSAITKLHKGQLRVAKNSPNQKGRRLAMSEEGIARSILSKIGAPPAPIAASANQTT